MGIFVHCVNWLKGSADWWDCNERVRDLRLHCYAKHQMWPATEITWSVCLCVCVCVLGHNCNAVRKWLGRSRYRLDHGKTVVHQKTFKGRCIHFSQKKIQPFNGPLSGTTQVSRYQKKHSPTHAHFSWVSWKNQSMLVGDCYGLYSVAFTLLVGWREAIRLVKTLS